MSQYQLIAKSNLDQSELLERLFAQGFDSDKRGTKTRLSAVNRIIKGGHIRKAMEKIRDSAEINREHPEAREKAEKILAML